jgi:hypothetical protein
MVVTIRALLRSIAALVATALWPAKAAAPQPSGGDAMAAFIARLRSDEALRARVRDSPTSGLLAAGIDPAPFRLPDRLTEAELDRLLADWSRGEAAEPPAREAPRPPVVIYGPPPGLRR